MEGALHKIQTLIVSGDKFNYSNFSLKGARGYPSAFNPDWVSWVSRVDGAIKSLFGEKSAPVEVLKSAKTIILIGNGEDKFELAKSHYMGALVAAEATLQEDTFGELVSTSEAKGPFNKSNKVFIVHGHDDESKGELEALLNEMGLEPVVLHRQADGGKTIIEKFEHYADVGYAFILMTPDEMSYLQGEDAKPDNERHKELRARPNVIFEFGYFVGRLGRERTCCLLKGNVTVPSDLSGLVYKKYSQRVEEVAYAITKELRKCGYKLKEA